jgi:microcystin-dependent protein
MGLLLPGVGALAQAVPPLMNFQGQVLNADGGPLATGDYELTFRVFDAVEGGTLIWGPQILDGAGGVGHGPKIPVTQGYFNVMLGPVDTAGRPLADAFLGASRFLEIKVNSNDPISPRQQILSTPYALKAANAANVLAGKVDVQALAQEVLDRLVPPGTVVAFAGSAVPAGWALCDGSVRNGSDAAFSAMFAAIGKTYGLGDGSEPSFNLPDLRGRTAIGAGQGTGLSSRALAAKLGIEAITQVPNHTHFLSLATSSGGSHTHGVVGRRSGGGSQVTLDTISGTLGTQLFDTLPAAAHAHSVSGNTGNPSGGVASVDNFQPSLVLNYIIKL